MNKNQEQEFKPALEQDESMSFLLRAWAEKPARETSTGAWRYSLVDLKTRAQRGFGDLDSLMAYFRGMESEAGRDKNDRFNQGGMADEG